MPQGASDIPDLRLSNLTKLITKFTSAPNLYFSNRFGSSNEASDTIKWESHVGVRAMAPFKAPGGKTPQTAPRGIAEHEAKAAMMGEKMLLDEEFLNNLREPGTVNVKMNARRKLARELMNLRYRCDRRKEWMFVKMFSKGTFDYIQKGGIRATVTYNIPTANKVTLASGVKWGTGTPDIMGDIRTAKEALELTTDASRFVAYTTQTVLKYMVVDSTVQALFQKSRFGDGNLFGRSNNNVIGVRTDILGEILDIDIVILNERYTVEAVLTAAVTGGATTSISVSNAEDFEVGQTLRFYDISAGTYEDETITGVNEQQGTVVVGTAPTASFKAGEDIVVMTKTFMDNDLVVFMPATYTVENQMIAEWMNAPFGIPGQYGVKLDRKDEWDPEATWIRAQNKGLPVLYFPEAVYILDVE